MTAPVISRATLDFATSSYYTRTYQLICEGSCNRQIADVDRAVAARPNGPYLTRSASLRDGDTIQLQRTLVYTPHAVGTDETRAFCTVCGRSRQYGGNPRVGANR